MIAGFAGCRVHSAEQWRSKPSDALVVLDWITITTGVTENIGVLFTRCGYNIHV